MDFNGVDTNCPCAVGGPDWERVYSNSPIKFLNTDHCQSCGEDVTRQRHKQGGHSAEGTGQAKAWRGDPVALREPASLPGPGSEQGVPQELWGDLGHYRTSVSNSKTKMGQINKV